VGGRALALIASLIAPFIAPMRLLYTLALYLLTAPILAWFWWRGRRDVGYRQRWGERFALQRMPAQAVGGLVVHAVSVGEVVAATPLIRALLAAYPELPITVTCTTPTGSARIAAAFGTQVHHCYLPLDLPGATRRFLQKLQPRALIILETELWPNLLAASRKALVPTIVVNARLSTRSARGYRRFQDQQADPGRHRLAAGPGPCHGAPLCGPEAAPYPAGMRQPEVRTAHSAAD